MDTPTAVQYIDRDFCDRLYRRNSTYLFGSDRTKQRYSRCLGWIELFAEDMGRDNEPPFVESFNLQGRRTYLLSQLASLYYHRMADIIHAVKLLPDQFIYNEKITEFKLCCSELGLLDNPPNWTNDMVTLHSIRGDEGAPDFAQGVALFNELVARLRVRYRSAEVVDKFLCRTHEMARVYQQGCAYADTLVHRLKGLVTIRVTLGFRPEFSKQIDLATANRCLDKFLHDRSNRRELPCIHGHIIKTEVDVDSGIGFDAFLFFNAEALNVVALFSIVEQVSEYWRNYGSGGKGDVINQVADDDREDGLERAGISVLICDANFPQRLNYQPIADMMESLQIFRPRVGAD